VSDIISTLKKLSTSFAKVQLWKQWRKLKDRSTANMHEEELETHREVVRLIQRDLQFAQEIFNLPNGMRRTLRTRMTSVCCNFNYYVI
jgi:hypothetical protein